jgi:hypothetical protein
MIAGQGQADEMYLIEKYILMLLCKNLNFMHPEIVEGKFVAITV